MLRALFLALVLANLGFYAWTQGWLDGVVGARAGGDREPERLTRQVQPETVVILPWTPASGVAATDTADAAARACLEAGPFSAVEIAVASAALKEALPRASNDNWADVKTEIPGSWIVFMGKFADAEGLAKKAQELKRLKVEFEEVRDVPALEPGLSLGRFELRASADKALERFTLQGIRTAKVVEMTAPASMHMLRAAHAEPDLAAQLGALRSSSLGKGFVACAKPR